MKDNLKKVMAVMLSAVMAMSLMMTTVVKAVEPTGAIKLTSSSQPLNGRTFEAYQLFNLKVSEGKDKFAYTEVTPQVTAGVVAALDQAVTDYNAAKDPNLTFTKEGATAKSIVAFLDENKDNTVFLNRFAHELQVHKNQLGTPKPAELAVEGDPILNATINGLPYGYYVVVETTVVDPQTKDKALSIAMLDNVYKDVNEIKVKSEVPSVEKTIQKDGTEVKGNDYNVGDEIIFNLKGTAPSNYVLSTYETYHYTFHDKLSKGLKVNSVEALQLTFAINGEPVEFVVNTETNEITYNGVKVGTVTLAVQPDGTTDLTIDFDLKAEPFNTLFNKEGQNKITVTYKAVLDKDAELGKPGNDNKVYIEYNNNPYTDEKGTSTESKVYSYTYGFDITKTDGTTKEVLAGATFKLYTNAACTDEYDIWATKTGEGKYLYSKTEGQPAVNEFKVDAQGKLYIDGLATGTYWLKETVAPDGYNLLEEPVKVEIKATYDETTGELKTLQYRINDQDVKDGDQTTGYVAATVENFSGALLPETGGMGTTMLYIVGVLAIVAGLGYFAFDKKRSNAQK